MVTPTSNAPRAHNAPKPASGAFSVQRGMDVPKALKTWLHENVSQETSVVHIRDAISEAVACSEYKGHGVVAEAIRDVLADLIESSDVEGLKALVEALVFLVDRGSVEQRGFVIHVVTKIIRDGVVGVNNDRGHPGSSIEKALEEHMAIVKIVRHSIVNLIKSSDEEGLKDLEEALTLLRDRGSTGQKYFVLSLITELLRYGTVDVNNNGGHLVDFSRKTIDFLKKMSKPESKAIENMFRQKKSPQVFGRARNFFFCIRKK